MQKLHLFLTALILLLLSVLSGSYNTGQTSDAVTFTQTNRDEPVVNIGMTNTMEFTPDTVRIKVGETVEWINNSLLVHTVTGDPSEAAIEGSAKLPNGANTFDSGSMEPEQTFTRTFDIAGTYQYFCIPHEGTKMYGWVIVE